MLHQKLENLAAEQGNPCVTISLNTHRTHPENAQDDIVLKTLVKEARDSVIESYGKRPAHELLVKLDALEEEIDSNHNMDSLHIFLSETTHEIIKSPWPIARNTVSIENSFAIRPLIKAVNRTEDYLILLLSQSGVKLYQAVNDLVSKEVHNDDFPFTEGTNNLKDLDGKQEDNVLREFMNQVDKALVKVHRETGLKCIVVCTDNNYSLLSQVADIPAIYYGHTKLNANDTATHTLAAGSWEIIKDLQQKRRAAAILEMQEAVGQGKVLTDISEIFRAAREGRGDLLIARNDFRQAIKMTGPASFELVDDLDQPDVIDDITSDIAWDVISMKGRAVFTDLDELKALGDIALKVRY